VFDLLMDADRVIGAIGYDTWNDRILQFEAKTVHLGTGACARLYPAMTPGWLFNIPIPATLTGDGRAMTLRAGGSLVGLESTARWAGPKYFSRSGKGTWIGVFREPSGKPVGLSLRNRISRPVILPPMSTRPSLRTTRNPPGVQSI